MSDCSKLPSWFFIASFINVGIVLFICADALLSETYLIITSSYQLVLAFALSAIVSVLLASVYIWRLIRSRVNISGISALGAFNYLDQKLVKEKINS